MKHNFTAYDLINFVHTSDLCTCILKIFSGICTFLHVIKTHIVYKIQ